MSTFTPTQMTLDPPNRPDHLAGAVLLSLARPIGKKPPSGPIKAFFLGAISFGVLPIVLWQARFKERLAGEQQQIWHFMEWITLRSGDPEALKMRDVCKRWAPQLTSLFSILVFGFVIGIIMVYSHGLENSHSLISPPMVIDQFPWIARPWHDPAWSIFSWVWTVSLSITYFWYVGYVAVTKGRMDWLVRRINPIFRRHGITEIPARSLGFPGILWILAGIIGAACGAWWAIPAAFAGWAQRAYALNVSWHVRQDLSQRIQTILIRQRPAVNVPTPNSQRPVCTNALCGKPAVSGAAFCTRCGTRIADVRFQAVA